MTQKINRREWYANQLVAYLALHPELVSTFIVLVCDEISISELDAIYAQLKEISELPPDQNLTKAMEN